MLLLGVLLLLVASHALLNDSSELVKSKPNILFVMVDDLGFGNVGFTSNLFTTKQTSPVFKPSFDHVWNLRLKNRETNSASSFITSLAQEGRILERHYVHCTCSPTRSSLQSGFVFWLLLCAVVYLMPHISRLPVHVQMSLLNPCRVNAGVPRQMTCIAERMKVAGYASHFVGKWDAGMAYARQTPSGRGYDTSLNFFSHGNWMWSEEVWVGSLVNATVAPPCTLDRGCAKDLWDTDRPAIHLNGTLYEEELFRNRMLEIIYGANPAVPLFLMYHPRVAHYPLQAPREIQAQFGFIPFKHRRVYMSMVKALDNALESIVKALKDTKRWENTLMVFTSDNGGVVKNPMPCVEGKHGTECFNGEAGGNNFPLRGGKYTNWEGGIRVATFVSGGYLPRAVRGVPVRGMMHVSDWFATLTAAAGLDTPFSDSKAVAASIPDLDSLNCLKLLVDAKAVSPRKSILLNSKTILVGKYKLLQGVQFGANWAGPLYPNLTTIRSPVYDSIMLCNPACVFNVEDDPLETTNLAPSQPALVRELQLELSLQAKTIWSGPASLVPDPQCFVAAKERWSGFLGPFKKDDIKSSETALY